MTQSEDGGKNFKRKKSEKIFFEKTLICEKVPSFCRKMIIYHKISMSGVYKNVFETSENYS